MVVDCWLVVVVAGCGLLAVAAMVAASALVVAARGARRVLVSGFCAVVL